MGWKRFKKETWRYLDRLSPEDIARDFINGNGNIKMIYTAYIANQPEERSSKIRENIKGLSSHLEFCLTSPLNH